MLKRVLKTWILVSFILFVTVAASYIGNQQVLRQSANDPQIQMAEDVAMQMQNGNYQPGLSNLAPIDIANSLDTFTIVYDKDGKVISSDAVLNGQTPQLPSGVFQNFKYGKDNFTWQPQNGVRIAVVMKDFGPPVNLGGYVLVGRNLSEVENRIQILTYQYTIGFIGAEIGAFILICGLEVVFKEKKK